MKHDPTYRPPVLLLHGLGGTGETLRPIARALERRGFTVTHPTLAEAYRRATLSGAGMTSGLAHIGLDFLLDEARTYAKRIAACGTPPIICGHSNGALLALALGSDDLAAGVVLMAPAPLPSVGTGVPLWLQQLFFRLAFGAGWQRGVLDLGAARRLDPDPPSPAIARTLLQDSGRVLSEAAALRPGSRFDPDPPLEVPCAVLAGDRDRIVPIETARRIAARYSAEVHVFQGAGHWFPAEECRAREIATRIAHLVGSALPYTFEVPSA